ncbi:MAG: hypothetical protein ACXVYV_07025 [Gaiellales bacterium]
MFRTRQLQQRYRLALVLPTTAVMLAAAALTGPAAQAATGCTSGALSQPFMPWGDPGQYAFLRNGGFERGSARWSLSGGAQVTAGNESFSVHSTADSRSLSLGSDGSATSSPICIGVNDPTVRFFASNGGSSLSALEVDVLYTDEQGNPQSLPVGVIAAGSDWAPTAPLPILANLTALPLVTDGTTEVSFRFTPLDGSGDWHVDDVYVDPFKTK